MTRDDPDRAADPSPLERAVDEGFLIIRAAAVVSVANTVIRRALQEHLPFDDEVATAAARDELRRLEAEQRDGIGRLRSLRRRTHRAYGQSRHQFDYRVDDIDALRLREATHKELAARIARSASDDAFVAALVSAARSRAWDDVGSTVVDRLGWAAAPSPDYDDGRDERIRTLLEVDLAALSAADGATTDDDGGGI